MTKRRKHNRRHTNPRGTRPRATEGRETEPREIDPATTSAPRNSEPRSASEPHEIDPSKIEQREAEPLETEPCKIEQREAESLQTEPLEASSLETPPRKFEPRSASEPRDADPATTSAPRKFEPREIDRATASEPRQTAPRETAPRGQRSAITPRRRLWRELSPFIGPVVVVAVYAVVRLAYLELSDSGGVLTPSGSVDGALAALALATFLLRLLAVIVVPFVIVYRLVARVLGLGPDARPRHRRARR